MLENQPPNHLFWIEQKLEKGIYIRLLKPNFPNGKHVLMMHGSFHNGQYWIETPDGREGWAVSMAKKVYFVYVPDMPFYGQSQNAEYTQNGVGLVEAMGYIIQQFPDWILFSHSISGPYGWKLLELYQDRISHLVAVAPGPMGNIQPIPTTKIDGSTVEIQTSNLVFKIGTQTLPSNELIWNWFIGQSQQFPINSKAIQNYKTNYLEPTPGSILLERMNFEGTQIKVGKDAQNIKSKILIIAGACDVNYPSSYLKQLQQFWTQRKCNSELILATNNPELTGNGHMLMIEQNNLEILNLILAKF